MTMTMTMTSRHHQKWILFALILAYTGLYFVYFPRLAAIEDEVGFINQAIVWSKGAMSSEAAGYGGTLADFQEVNGLHVASRSVKNSRC